MACVVEYHQLLRNIMMDQVMSVGRVKFATQVDAILLESVRQLAKAEGRQIQAVVEDALRQHLEAKSPLKGREHVMAAYLESTRRFSGLYEKLAK